VDEVRFSHNGTNGPEYVSSSSPDSNTRGDCRLVGVVVSLDPVYRSSSTVKVIVQSSRSHVGKLHARKTLSELRRPTFAEDVLFIASSGRRT